MKIKNRNIFLVIIVVLILSICISSFMFKPLYYFVTRLTYYLKSLATNKNNIQVKVLKERPRIVVTLTTSPLRIKKIKPVLDSMTNQTIPPDRIYLNLPNVFKRNNTTFDSPLPKFITDNKLIHINFCEDIGPATKILPVLDLEKDDQTLLFSIDDDIDYPQHLIETFLAFSSDYPDACITGSSYMFKKENKLEEKKPRLLRGTEVELLEGFSGVLYKRKFFNQTVLSQLYTSINENNGCKFGDDFSISNVLIKNGTKIIMIGNHFDAIWRIKPLEYGLDNDALHLGGSGQSNGGNYQVCSDYFKTKGELVIDYHK